MPQNCLQHNRNSSEMEDGLLYKGSKEMANFTKKWGGTSISIHPRCSSVHFAIDQPPYESWQDAHQGGLRNA